MDSYDDSVMVALLPINSEWCRQELPHLTLVYAGKVGDQSPSTYNEMCKDASAIAISTPVMTLLVMLMDVFGEGTVDRPRVDVLRLRNTPELMAMRRPLEKYNASEFAFNPHVTVGPAGEGPPGEVPRYIAFDRIGVFYGTEQMIFNLRR